MRRWEILQGDCREAMKTLPDASVDAIVTDPPYHLTTGKKGGTGEASVDLKTPYGRARVTTGFMGMQWDGGDVAFQPATWAECLRVLKPGGYLLAFSGTRTYHRMVCAVEDAGFEIRDQMAWVYGSGFPKSHNGPWGGTALKPAWEPIVMARKPLIGTVEENWMVHGTGGLEIDAGRVGGHDGRWPANLVHDGSDEVLAVFPQAPGQQGPISGTAPSEKTSGIYGRMRREGEASADSDNLGAVGFKMKPGMRRVDEGTAARFFYCAKASKRDRDEGLEALPDKLFGMSGAAAAAAAARGEMYDNGDGGVNRVTVRKNHHPTVKPTDLMRWLVRLVTPAGGVVLDPFTGSGSTGKAAMLEGFQFIGCELNPDYIKLAEARIAAAEAEVLW